MVRALLLAGLCCALASETSDGHCKFGQDPEGSCLASSPPVHLKEGPVLLMTGMTRTKVAQVKAHDMVEKSSDSKADVGKPSVPADKLSTSPADVATESANPCWYVSSPKWICDGDARYVFCCYTDRGILEVCEEEPCKLGCFPGEGYRGSRPGCMSSSLAQLVQEHGVDFADRANWARQQAAKAK